MITSQYTSTNYNEEYSYDGDADDDSFQSAICEKYDGFKLMPTTPVTPISSEKSRDMLHTRERVYEIVCTSGDGNPILYELDKNDISDNDVRSTSSNHSALSVSLNDNADDLSYIPDEDSLYHTETSTDDDIEQEYLMLTALEGRNVIFTKLNTSFDKLRLRSTVRLSPQKSTRQCISAEEATVGCSDSDRGVISNIQDLEPGYSIPHLESTYISETDQSSLSRNSYG